MEVKKCILLHKVDWIQDKVKHNLILFHHKVENFLQKVYLYNIYLKFIFKDKKIRK